jgi:tetratricopeptide (TPR) repeat protein
MTARLLTALCGLLLVLLTGSVFGHGGYHERIDYLTAQIDSNPSDPLLYFELANLHGQHGDLQLSLQDLDRVDALAPAKFLTDLLRGDALLVAGEVPKAKEALARQLVSHPECARAWLLRARAEERMGEETVSLADYREAFKRITSPDPDLVQEVASALATHGCEKEAAQVLATGIEKLGKIPSLVLRALDLEIATKNFDAALHRVAESQREAPRPEPWMARRASLLAKAGRPEESRAAWNELARHLDSLPDQERTSYAMTRIAEEARHALGEPKSVSAGGPPPIASSTSTAN